jgi:HK97 family phage portal protein
MPQRLFEKRDSFHVRQEPPGWVVKGYGNDSYAGKSVSVEGSLSVTAVMAGFTILSEDSASLPLVFYRRLKRGKERAYESPYYKLLHDEPNPEHTSMVYRELIVGHMLGWGNHYSQKIWDKRGVLRELWPLRPDRMQVFRENGQRKYLYTEQNNNKRAFRADEIWHVPAWGFDGLTGISRITQARNAIGLAMATEEYGSKTFANGARPALALIAKKKLTDAAMKNLQESWNQVYQGSENSNKTAVIETDIDIKEIGFPPEDAQFLQTRQFQVSEIARIFRIPPHMIGDVEKSTSWGTGIEQQEIGYLTHTLRPWLTRIEQSAKKDLLLSEEKAIYYWEHLVDAMLRSDIQTRFAAYVQAITNGFMTRNEVRERENMNPLDGLDRPLVPLNMTDGGAPAQPKTRSGFGPIWRDAADRIVRRETNELRDAGKRWLEKDKADKYAVWLEKFYKSDLRAFIGITLKPFVDAGLMTEERAQTIIDDYCDKRGELMQIEPREPEINDFFELIEVVEEINHE